jgi:glycosyltransferase involved in cell wall biosynthesis
MRLVSGSPTELTPVATNEHLYDMHDSSIHVLVVSNHSEVQKRLLFSGICADRQTNSLMDAGIRVSTFDIGTTHSPLRLFRKWRELRREIKMLKPDIVHARYGTVVAVLSVLSGLPTIITFCGSDLNSGAAVSNFRAYIGRLLSNTAVLAAARIICVSEGLRQALWWRKDNAIVIPDGIDLECFIPGDRNQARKDLGWELDAPVVLFNLGDDPKKKGFELAKASVNVAQNRIPNIKLYIVQNIHPSLMPVLYRAADALLLTSLNEGSPNVVKEALACNLPVVSVPVGDVSERLKSVSPSAVVSRDPDKIGKTLVNILLTRKRSNGRDYVQQLALTEIAKRVISTYRSVLEDQRRSMKSQRRKIYWNRPGA